MTQILYTSVTEVLGAIGLPDPDEFPDNLFSDGEVVEDLTVEISSLVPGHVALKAKVDDNTATTDEQALYMLTKLYCKWFVALWAAESTLVFEKDTGDGKAFAKRFEKAVEGAQAKARKYMDKYRTMIREAIGTDVYEPPQLVGLSKADYNPVTN